VNLKAKKFMQLQGGGRYKSFKLSCQIGLRKVCLSGGEPQQLVFSLGQEGEILKQQSSPPGPGTIWTDGWTPVNRLLLGVIEVRYDHARRCWDAKKGLVKIDVRRARGDAKLCNVEIDYSSMLNNEKMDCRLEKQVSIKSGLLLSLKYTISLRLDKTASDWRPSKQVVALQREAHLRTPFSKVSKKNTENQPPETTSSPIPNFMLKTTDFEELNEESPSSESEADERELTPVQSSSVFSHTYNSLYRTQDLDSFSPMVDKQPTLLKDREETRSKSAEKKDHKHRHSSQRNSSGVKGNQSQATPVSARILDLQDNDHTKLYLSQDSKDPSRKINKNCDGHGIDGSIGLNSADRKARNGMRSDKIVVSIQSDVPDILDDDYPGYQTNSHQLIPKYAHNSTVEHNMSERKTSKASAQLKTKDANVETDISSTYISQLEEELLSALNVDKRSQLSFTTWSPITYPTILPSINLEPLASLNTRSLEIKELLSLVTINPISRVPSTKLPSTFLEIQNLEELIQIKAARMKIWREAETQTEVAQLDQPELTLWQTSSPLFIQSTPRAANSPSQPEPTLQSVRPLKRDFFCQKNSTTRYDSPLQGTREKSTQTFPCVLPSSSPSRQVEYRHRSIQTDLIKGVDGQTQTWTQGIYKATQTDQMHKGKIQITASKCTQDVTENRELEVTGDGGEFKTNIGGGRLVESHLADSSPSHEKVAQLHLNFEKYLTQLKSEDRMLRNTAKADESQLEKINNRLQTPDKEVNKDNSLNQHARDASSVDQLILVSPQPQMRENSPPKDPAQPKTVLPVETNEKVPRVVDSNLIQRTPGEIESPHIQTKIVQSSSPLSASVASSNIENVDMKCFELRANQQSEGSEPVFTLPPLLSTLEDPKVANENAELLKSLAMQKEESSRLTLQCSVLAARIHSLQQELSLSTVFHFANPGQDN
jgi:hypothetical protein